jgi:alpha-tubulin suppressor-like RCC1 family protein
MRRVALATALLLAAGCFEAPVTTVMPGGDRGGGGAGGGGGPGGGGGIGGAAPLPVCDAVTASPCATVEHIWAGGTFTCAGLDDDSVRCFGLNDSGQLGDPAEPTSLFASQVTVADASASARVVLGHRHGCTIDDGALRCWGRNTVGQLGTGDLTFAAAPAPNLVTEPVLDLATYHSATCAIVGSGVLCWGHDLNGQGWSWSDGGDRVLTPTPVPGLEDVEAIGVGPLAACALTSDSSIWCWGYGLNGELGDGALTSSATPVKVAASLASPVRHLAVGSGYACVLAGEPAVVQCWGVLPQLDQLTPTPLTLPEQPMGTTADLQAGQRHACVRLEDGRVQCWGLNDLGALGTGGFVQSEAPSSVVGLDDAVDLAVGNHHVCALREGGEMVCWGDAKYGQLGISPDDEGQNTPRPVVWND